MGISIEALIKYPFISMSYNEIKSFPIYNNIASMNISSIISLFSTDFSLVDINNIEDCTTVIYDDGISLLTITISHILTQ